MQMRDYQALSSRAIHEACEKFGSCLAEIATGLGKSLVAADLSTNYDRVMISTPIKETMRQLAGTVKRYRRYSPEIEQADLWATPGAPVTVACLQSLLSNNRITRFLDHLDLFIVDEAHYAMGKRFQWLLDLLRERGIKIAALTATPHFRPNGISPITQYACHPVSIGVRQGIEWGWLVPIKARRCVLQELDMSRFSSSYGGHDFLVEELDKALAEERVMLESAAMIAANHSKPGVVFTTSIANATKLAEILDGRHGIPTSVVHTGKGMGDKEREQQMRRFESGATRLIVNVGCLTTGWDSPKVQEIHNLRPTRSLPKYLQQLGRLLRPCNNGIFEGRPTDYLRRHAISQSEKPHGDVYDYTDASKHHQICCAADAFVPPTKKRERYIEERINRDEPVTIEAIDEAVAEEKRRDAMDAIRAKQELVERRKSLVFRATVSSEYVNLFKQGEASTPKRREARMIYGKYKGIPLRMIPADYLKWWVTTAKRSPGTEWLVAAVHRELKRIKNEQNA